ncbi:MAG: hypothetical protein HYY28_04600 [Betaproteobacteria bacterium]|nr:hypothetical protein [Betaproteobacteria bacterium]MBI2959571.1 hypothetical protein [Betaproteobacteria bacterium]
MRHSTGRVGAALVVGALLSPLAASGQGVAHKVITTSVASSGAHKECLSLAGSQRLRYWFRADGPLDFDIQVQVGREVRYPVRRRKVSMGSGIFAPKVSEVHCMVLTNSAEHPVTVRLEFARFKQTPGN